MTGKTIQMKNRVQIISNWCDNSDQNLKVKTLTRLWGEMRQEIFFYGIEFSWFNNSHTSGSNKTVTPVKAEFKNSEMNFIDNLAKQLFTLHKMLSIWFFI
jgi:hypothetical protein